MVQFGRVIIRLSNLKMLKGQAEITLSGNTLFILFITRMTSSEIQGKGSLLQALEGKGPHFNLIIKCLVHDERAGILNNKDLCNFFLTFRPLLMCVIGRVKKLFDLCKFLYMHAPLFGM